jgi:2-oxoglutarate dehydrogenase E2 component (dihydrolipoamide succinyltransferase)/2-oxoisovalerate dehydrogenase E2 component (dihydrolipoyl transacylase)
MSNPRVPLILPDLGVPEVEVGVWYAQPGDHIYRGDRLVEVVLTEGATFDVTAPCTGTLVNRYVMLKDRVAPGAILGAVIADAEQ